MSNGDHIYKAYIDVLKREPDSSGYNFYKRKNISYEKLCDELINSPEYVGDKKKGNHEASRWSALKWPHDQIFVAENLKIVYCPIAKNACSTLKRLIAELSDVANKENILEGDIHSNTDLYKTGLQVKDYHVSEAEKILVGPGYFRFAVLRNPSSRLLSAYWEKFVLNREDEANLEHTRSIIEAVQIKNKKISFDSSVEINFSDFVNAVTSYCPEELDPHWKPQYTYLRGVEYDALYNQENMRRLYQDLSSIAGRDVSPKSFNVSNSGSGMHINNAMFMLPGELLKYKNVSKESFFNPDINRKVADFFKEDFALLECCKN